MKLYLLRHEKRYNDPTFSTELTEEGKSSANTTLKHKLSTIKIDAIFCSPFIRALQTIQPYLNETNQSTSIEYCICEGLHDNQYSNLDISLPDNFKTIFNINTNYTSVINPHDIKYPESNDDGLLRVGKFIDYLNTKYTNNESILLCTHQCIIHYIIALFCKVDIKVLDYKMGDLSLIGSNLLNIL